MNPNKHWVLALLLLLPAVRGGTGTGAQDTLRNIRDKAMQQLSKSANYTCVETIERSYLESTLRLPNSCATEDVMNTREFMHDRLHLNVAVSEAVKFLAGMATTGFRRRRSIRSCREVRFHRAASSVS